MSIQVYPVFRLPDMRWVAYQGDTSEAGWSLWNNTTEPEEKFYNPERFFERN
jgi:myosin-crossreactive antigen